MLAKLSTLHPSLLRNLAGEIVLGAREPVLRKLLGAEKALWLAAAIKDMQGRGWSPPLLSEALNGMAAAAEERAEPSDLLELVVTNPFESESPARDTRAVMLSLFEQAEIELLIVGYALHKSANLLRPLADKMLEKPGFNVCFCLDLRKPVGWSNEGLQDYLHQFAVEFQDKHWPWRPLPEVWLDDRSWRSAGNEGRGLHAKCIVADCAQALITSANLTEAAQYRNIEISIETLKQAF